MAIDINVTFENMPDITPEAFLALRGEKGEKGERGDAGIVDSEMSDSSTSAVQNRVIKDYVDTGLSSKADTSTASTAANGLMSSADKTKLDGIADGAEKNYVTGIGPSTSSPDQDQTNYTDYTLSYRISGNISDSIHVPNTKVATTAKRGLMSPTDKAKLDGIEGEAEKNVLTSIGYNASLTESSYALTYRTYGGTDTIDVPSTNLATTSKRGLMSSTDKTKLDGITATDISNWDEGLLDFDTAASSGDDYELTQILTSLGWLNDVIV